ncbi:MAG: MarR family transcriptional regulator [Tissierellales bacterium]|nr:MarR family transcriptional regulator [Tissierellales bacterium]
MILNDYNLTAPQFTALQILINSGGMTISELSQKMDLACSTITDLVDRMEKSELVKRTRDEKDKRVVRVTTLKKGGEVLNKVMDKRISFLESKLENLSSEEKESLMNALEKLYINMSDEYS